MTSAPIIVSALFRADDFSWLNGLRRTHFPAAKVDAHLTLFHHLPPSIASELKRRMTNLTRSSPPAAVANGLINLGRGVAIQIHSPQLVEIRAELARALSGLLTPQDAANWRPHVTIQNKVEPAEARLLYTSLASTFRPRPMRISALAAWWYRDGPWELLSRHPFR
jgi:2'-5' RNA ligase